MNLHSRKARIPIAALGVTALCTTGLGVLAGSASAATTLTISPTTTTVNTLNIGHAVSSGALPDDRLAATAYGIRVTSANNPLKLSVDSYTAPGASTPSALTSGLYYKAMATDVPTAAATWSGVNASASAPVLSANIDASASPYIYLAPDQPGTYKIHLVDAQGTVATDDDLVTPTITLNVKDVEAATGTTADDWAPSIVNNPTSANIGAPITTTVGLSALTLVDGRGSSNNKGVLGDALAARTGVSFAGAGVGATAYSGVSNPDGTKLLATGSTSSAASPLVATARFDNDGDGSFTSGFVALGSASTTVTSNSVTGVNSLAVTPATGSVVSPTSTTATLKSGTATATYSATAVNGSTPVAGATMYFTLTPTPSTVSLTADGTLVSSDASSGAKIYAVTTNSSGVASIAVTSGTTTAGVSYTVAPSSNAATVAAPTSITATYANAAASTFVSTNTAAELNPTAASGVSVTLKGKVLDQFGAAFTPASSATQTTTVAVNGSTVCNAVIGTDGTFSCTYTPATTPTSGTSVPYSYAYAGATTYNGNINFASSTAASAISLTAPVDASTVTVAKASNPLPAGAAVTGKVTDASNAGLAYKQVTVTGSDGVKFSTVANPSASTSADDLVNSLTTTTDSSGNITGAYAFYLKTGAAMVTVAAGTGVSKTANVTVNPASTPDSYKVTVNDVSGTPGSTLIVTGTVVDGFGNPAPNANVDLSVGTSTVGALGATTVTTNAAGVYSTTFVTGSNKSGEATLTATLSGQTANAKANAEWLTKAGITIPNGEYQDQAKVDVKDFDVTLEATAALVGGGKAHLSGTANPTESVEIWAKPSGEAGFSLIGTVKTDGDGEWGVGVTVKRSTAWFAKSNGQSSAATGTTVYSYQTVKAKALGGGKVEFEVFGVPNVKGTATVWYGSKKLGSMTTNSSGDATLTVQSSKGRKSFKIYFAAPGTSLKGTILTGTVK